MFRRVLIGLCTLVVLLVGVMGMRALKDMREPPQRQVIDNPGPVVRGGHGTAPRRAFVRCRLWNRTGETRVANRTRSVGDYRRVVAAVASRASRRPR